MSPSGCLPGFRESAMDLPGVCQALAESRKAQSLASKISKAFMGRLGKTAGKPPEEPRHTAAFRESATPSRELPDPLPPQLRPFLRGHGSKMINVLRRFLGENVI